MESESFPNSDQQKNIRRPLVLAVDDNEDNLILLTQVLQLLDCSFISSKDGHTAVLLAQNYRPDLVLLDIMLPDVDGVQVVHRLKQDPQTMKIPIVAITAMARVEDRERMLLAGCNDYIKKPYIIDELEAKIRRYLC
jgi:CheY-like chemotaxis protein